MVGRSINLQNSQLPGLSATFLKHKIRIFYFTFSFEKHGGTRWRSLTRHSATCRKFAGSIPDGVTGIFHLHNPFGRTRALGSTQPLTEISTRNIFWGVKAAGAYDRQPYHIHALIVLKSGSLNLLGH
jgi:hypothetical protein